MHDHTATANGVNGQVSTYVEYLPSPYQADTFLGRFLLIFESVLAPIEQTIDGVANYFDPRLAPVEFMPWLASWIGVDLDENLTLAQRRELLAEAAELLRRQGTRYALREHLRLYVGQSPLIVENFSGLRLGQDGLMGVNSRLGTLEPHTLTVTVLTDHNVDEAVLRRVIQAEKPTYVGYTLEIFRTDLQAPPPTVNDDSEPASPVGPSPRESNLAVWESV